MEGSIARLDGLPAHVATVLSDFTGKARDVLADDLVSVVLFFGIGAGLAVLVLVMHLDRSFATLSQLRNLGIPILGNVSRLSLGAARRQAAFQLAGVTASALVLVAVYGTLLVLSIGPRSIGIS